MIWIGMQGSEGREIYDKAEIRRMNRILGRGQCPICEGAMRERDMGVSCDKCKRHFIIQPSPITGKEQSHKDYFRL